ncbi:MAG TPA: hypothetical protein PKJ78_18170 [Candidatus Hydrogenedentes bacterium]|nr:hypothetical protein [Candidatus Hydrogenedentota bacterium]
MPVAAAAGKPAYIFEHIRDEMRPFAFRIVFERQDFAPEPVLFPFRQRTRHLGDEVAQALQVEQEPAVA